MKKQSTCGGSVLNEWSQEYESTYRYRMSVHGTMGLKRHSSLCPVANTPHSSYHYNLAFQKENKKH